MVEMIVKKYVIQAGLDPKKVKLIRHSLTDKNFKECYDADKVFVTYIGGQEDYKKQLESLATDKPIYLLLNIPAYSYFDDDNPLEAFYYIDHYDTKTKKATHTKIYEKDFDDKVVSFYKNLSITKNFEYIGRHDMFGRTYKVYRLA